MKIFIEKTHRTLFIFAIIFFSNWGGAKASSSMELDFKHKVAHLFDRLAFGARPGDEDKLSKQGPRGIEEWIHEQLEPEKINDASLEAKLKGLPSLAMDMPSLILRYKKPQEVAKSMGLQVDDFKKNEALKKEVRKKIGEENLPERLVEEIVAQKIIRAVESRKQLQEILVDFWYNHFNIDIQKGVIKWMLSAYEREAIRPHLFGKFRDLLGATAHHPAMLFYLDNHLSQNGEKNRRGLNENYARELLELHTLGVDGGYTQKDVTELARILTGWGIERPNIAPAFMFFEGAHDKGEKILLGHKFAAGVGIQEGEAALDMLALHPSTAKFLATKLCRYFVTDKPPAELVDRISKVYLSSGGDLKKVYLALFKSPEFWSKTYYRSKIKSPFQFVVSALRAAGGEVAVQSELPRHILQMGEPLYHCAPPTGYKDVAEAWVNPGALVERLNFALKLAANNFNGLYVQLPAVQVNTAPKLVKALSEKLLHEKLSLESEKIVISEFDNENRLMADGEIRPLSLAKAMGMILGSPEFQRR